MQPALRNLLIEAAIVLVVLGFLLWISIPRFLAAQSINTPDNFPDPNFRKVIEKFMGVEPEGIFSARKAAAKTERLLCIGCFVGSTKGIEFFPNITRFDCSGNPLNENPDISRNTALTDFRCRSSQVTALDFSKNTALQIVDCFDNKITNLDISRNPALAELECSHNQIVKLDLSKNVNLNDLRCSENLLETLDVSACKNLEKFSCGYNRLQKLDVSQNPSLRMFSCTGNPIARLDLSANVALQHVGCGSNRMTTLILGSHPVLEGLWCIESRLESLDVSRCPALRKLYLQSNRFESIPDLTNNPVVDTLDIRENRLDLDDIDAIRQLKNHLPAPIYSQGSKTALESGFIYSPQQSGDLLLPDAEITPGQGEQ